MRVFTFLLLISIIGGCAKQNTTTSDSSMENYEKLAYESLNVQPIEFEKNSKDDHVLATYYKDGKQVPGTGVLNYLIINIEDETVIKQGVLPQGRISWISDYELEIFSPPGIPKDQAETADDYTTIYNVKNGKSSDKKGANY